MLWIYERPHLKPEEDVWATKKNKKQSKGTYLYYNNLGAVCVCPRVHFSDVFLWASVRPCRSTRAFQTRRIVTLSRPQGPTIRFVKILWTHGQKQTINSGHLRGVLQGISTEKNIRVFELHTYDICQFWLMSYVCGAEYLKSGKSVETVPQSFQKLSNVSSVLHPASILFLKSKTSRAKREAQRTRMLSSVVGAMSGVSGSVVIWYAREK